MTVRPDEADDLDILLRTALRDTAAPGDSARAWSKLRARLEARYRSSGRSLLIATPNYVTPHEWATHCFLMPLARLVR